MVEYRKVHSRVVLHRSVSSNAHGLKESLLFFRCQDATAYAISKAGAIVGSLRCPNVDCDVAVRKNAKDCS